MTTRKRPSSTTFWATSTCSTVASTTAIFYVRPHEIEILRDGRGTGTIAAKIRDIRPLGATVRIELERIDGRGAVEVELTRDQFGRKGLSEGDKVYLQPKRLRTFDGNTKRETTLEAVNR